MTLSVSMVTYDGKGGSVSSTANNQPSGSPDGVSVTFGGGGTITQSIHLLQAKPAPEIRLDAARTPAPIRAKIGLEREQSGKVKSEQVTVQSSDGLFTFVVRVVKP